MRSNALFLSPRLMNAATRVSIRLGSVTRGRGSLWVCVELFQFH